MNINKLARIVGVVVLMSTTAAVGYSQTPKLVKRTTTKTDRFDFGSGGTIVITGAPTGSIKIVGSQKNEVEVTAEIEVQAASEAEVAKLAEVTGFASDETAIRASVMSVGSHNKFGLKKLPKNFAKNLLGLPFTINYTVTVPRYSDLEIEGGKGDLSITGVEGSMQINFIECKAYLEIVGGSTAVTVGTGSIDVALGVRGWRGRSANIQIATGDLSVHLPSNMSAEIDAVILKNGSIKNSLLDLKPRDRKVPFTEKSILAKAGVGGSPLKFTVGSGTLTIDRLVQPR